MKNEIKINQVFISFLFFKCKKKKKIKKSVNKPLLTANFS